MVCGFSKQVIFEDFDIKKWVCQDKWPVKTGGLSSEVSYITNPSIPRNVACQTRWPVIVGGLFGRFDCMYIYIYIY